MKLFGLKRCPCASAPMRRVLVGLVIAVLLAAPAQALHGVQDPAESDCSDVLHSSLWDGMLQLPQVTGSREVGLRPVWGTAASPGTWNDARRIFVRRNLDMPQGRCASSSRAMLLLQRHLLL
jgi:hypothetical protein